MRIHRDVFHDIIQNVINEYDERIKMTIRFIAPMNFFRRDLYANVMDIIKTLMYKREYIYDNYDYPEHTTRYIIGVHNKIIEKLCKYAYERCYEYRGNNADCEKDVKTMFDISEPIEEKGRKTPNGQFILPTSVIGKFIYPPIDNDRDDMAWKEQAMADAFDEYNNEDRGEIDIPYLGLPDDEQEIGHWNLD